MPEKTRTSVDITGISRQIIANVEHVVVGKRQQIVKVLVAWYCEGHVLLEDVPGVAKTILARAFAKSVNCTFRRVQCTPDLLPTDGEALAGVLRASIQPDRGSGSDDDKVVAGAVELLRGGGLLSIELRRAAWEAALTVPGVIPSTGSDSRGRPGEVLEYTQSDGTTRKLVRDPGTGLLLEEDTTEENRVVVYVEQRTVTEVPVEPTLENAGTSEVCALAVWSTVKLTVVGSEPAPADAVTDEADDEALSACHDVAVAAVFAASPSEATLVLRDCSAATRLLVFVCFVLSSV